MKDAPFISFIKNDKNEAIEKWNRRRIRLINYIKDNGVNSLIFKLCDTYCEKHDWAKNEAEFNALPFERKIFFTTGRKNKILNDGEKTLMDQPFLKVEFYTTKTT